MLTSFFRKITMMFCVSVIVCSVALAFLMKSTGKNGIKNVYFLVYPTDSVEAAALSVELRGGAGYYLKNEGIALHVYTNVESANNALDGLESEYSTAFIVGRPLVVDSQRQKVLWQSLGVIERLIVLLEEGCRQSSAKDVLCSVGTVLRANNEGNGLSVLLANELAEIEKDGIFTAELRCFLCSAYDRFSQKGVVI